MRRNNFKNLLCAILNNLRSHRKSLVQILQALQILLQELKEKLEIKDKLFDLSRTCKTPTIFSRITTLSPIAALDIQSREAQRQKTKPARSQICKAAISNQKNSLPKSYITSLIDTTKYDYTRFINIPQGGIRCL